MKKEGGIDKRVPKPITPCRSVCPSFNSEKKKKASHASLPTVGAHSSGYMSSGPPRLRLFPHVLPLN